MHTAALAELGIGDAWSYEAIEVEPDGFEALVRSLPDEGFAGVNVTVPHKLAALALADSESAAAQAIGAANTLSFDGASIAAENTDAVGISGAIGEPVDGKRALVLGAGGSARAAVYALRNAGAAVSSGTERQRRQHPWPRNSESRVESRESNQPTSTFCSTPQPWAWTRQARARPPPRT